MTKGVIYIIPKFKPGDELLVTTWKWNVGVLWVNSTPCPEDGAPVYRCETQHGEGDFCETVLTTRQK